MRRFVLYGVIVFQILLIISLVRGIQLSARSKERIERMQQTKEKLLVEREKLKQEQEYVQSPFYLEEVARNELHLSKEGETVVIIPESIILGEGNSSQESVISRDKPNWQKWWGVVSGSN
ncbi:septum formation initiator family protein [Candidatus Woesebacteria bacterium]|nr:septum formation initiator family protein [Candidatus Woesebacteria bacterium]